jgi:hypothetical protein
VVADVAGIDDEVVQRPSTMVAHPVSRGEAHSVATRRGRAWGA